jgi:hypothetical protein
VGKARKLMQLQCQEAAASHRTAVVEARTTRVLIRMDLVTGHESGEEVRSIRRLENSANATLAEVPNIGHRSVQWGIREVRVVVLK